MKDYERAEVAALPDKYRPLSSWAYFGYSLLFSLGIIGFVCVIVFACSNENVARRNFARSFIIGWIFAIIIIVVLAVVFYLVVLPFIIEIFPPEETFQCFLNLL